VFGMIIGVPLFTVIYMWIRDVLYDKLRKKGLSTETDEYIDKDYWKKSNSIRKINKEKEKNKENKIEVKNDNKDKKEQT